MASENKQWRHGVRRTQEPSRMLGKAWVDADEGIKHVHVVDLQT